MKTIQKIVKNKYQLNFKVIIMEYGYFPWILGIIGLAIIFFSKPLVLAFDPVVKSKKLSKHKRERYILIQQILRIIGGVLLMGFSLYLILK